MWIEISSLFSICSSDAKGVLKKYLLSEVSSIEMACLRDGGFIVSIIF